MITTFTKKQNISKNFENLFGLLTPKLSCERKFFRNELVLNYFVNKKLKQKDINKTLRGNTKNVLYPEYLDPLYGKFLSKYVQSKSFLGNLCVNAFLKVLDISNIKPEILDITLLDLSGKYVDLLDKLIFYSKSISVVSNNLKIYSEKQEKLLEKYGASVTVNGSLDWLFKSKILISPDKIKIHLPLRQDCITFTSEANFLPVKGTLYCDFKFPKFRKLKEILPEDISQEYFLAALYDICKKTYIKNLVPYYCFNGCEYISLKNVARKIFMQF